jgi:hypothetical protein
MNSEDVRSGIAKSWEFLDSLELGEAFVTPTPLTVIQEFRKVALNVKSLYTDVYESGLALSHYNILLFDLAFFQFGWSGENEVRYAYYPNPFISGNKEAQVKLQNWREAQSADILSEEDVSALIASLTTSGTVPLIRYENSPSQYRSLRHPCSHMHIGLHSENRWPLARVLTPLAFSMWIVKQYYTDSWSVYDDETHPIGNRLEQDLIDEQAKCRILGEELFGPSEVRSLHIR